MIGKFTCVKCKVITYALLPIIHTTGKQQGFLQYEANTFILQVCTYLHIVVHTVIHVSEHARPLAD